MRKVKIWGGEHPDELAALVCVDSLAADPIPNVSPGVSNVLARRLGKRLVDVNMAGAFPGDPSSPNYEERRAVEVLRESEGFDVTVNLHNFHVFGRNMAAIDAERGVSPIVLDFLGDLGIRGISLTDYGGIQRYASNAIALELDPNGLGSDIEKLRSAFDALANGTDYPRASVDEFEWFRYLGSANVTQFDPDRLPELTRRELHNFTPLPDTVAASLGYDDVPVHMMTWRYTPNEQGYWGELVTPIPTPDSVAWAK